jgi:uracil-DNA glycosylase family 4
MRPGFVPVALGGGSASTSRPGPEVRTLDPWESLRLEIESCTRCPLHQTRTQAVVYRGGRRPHVVVVGEAPGAAEDREGRPFVGRSGQRLNAALSSLGLGEERVGILNLLKCRPPANRFDPVAARTCRPYLDRQLTLLDPPRLVSLGARALAALDPTAAPVLQCAGRPREALGRPLFPLIHPAAVRSTALARRWADDVAALGRWLETAPPLTPRESL